jgi:anti-sigma factor ChrR (cupin superfamily)
MKTQYFVLLVVLLAAVLAVAQAGERQPAQQPTSSMPSMQTPAAGSGRPEVVIPAAIQWTSYMPGVEMAVLSGNPDAGGPYTIRLKMADGNQIAPHWHPMDENLTVLTGTLQVGMGEKFDTAALKPLPVGSHVLMPKQMPHFAKASGETVIELYGEGPFKINYVNPADDPLRAKQ